MSKRDVRNQYSRVRRGIKNSRHSLYGLSAAGMPMLCRNYKNNPNNLKEIGRDRRKLLPNINLFFTILPLKIPCITKVDEYQMVAFLFLFPFFFRLAPPFVGCELSINTRWSTNPNRGRSRFAHTFSELV